MAVVGYSTGNICEGIDLPTDPAAAGDQYRIHTIKSINFITVSDAVLSLWSSLGQGPGGALMDVQPLKITIT